VDTLTFYTRTAARSRTRTSPGRLGSSSTVLVDPDGSTSCHDPQDARAGHEWFRLPLFIWAHYATALIMVLGTRDRITW